MKITITFSDGTQKEYLLSDAQEKALFVDIVNPDEWIDNFIKEKARKVIDYWVEREAGVSRFADQSVKEEAFLNLDLPTAKELQEQLDNNLTGDTNEQS